MTRYSLRYRKVSRRLSRLALMQSSMDAFEDWDPRTLMERPPRRFLDFYGDDGVRLGLERYGLFEALRRRGYDGFDIQTRADDERHTLIVSGAHAQLAEPTHLLELVVRRDRLVPDSITDLEPMDVLTVDWLSLRNPVAHFTEQRPRLPGQDAPGSGIGERVLEVLYRVVDRLKLGGILTVAEYFHNAVLYRRELPFFDPEQDGRLLELTDELMVREALTLAQASWAIDWGFVREDDQTFHWRGEAQVRAMDPRLRAYLQTPQYIAGVKAARAAAQFAVDREAFDERWADHGALLAGSSGSLRPSGE